MRKLFKLIIILAILGGIGYVIYSNNFAMTLVFKADNAKAVTVINDALADHVAWDYYEIDVVTQDTNSDTDESLKVEASLKIVELEDDSYEFTATVKETEGTTVTEYESYYKEGIYYINNEGSQTWFTATIAETMTSIFGSAGGAIFPLTGEPIEESDFTAIDVEFGYSFFPLYVGQKFNLTNALYSATVEVDFLGNLRVRNMWSTLGFITRSIKTKFVSVNKELTLVFPTDLDTYSEAI